MEEALLFTENKLLIAALDVPKDETDDVRGALSMLLVSELNRLLVGTLYRLLLLDAKILLMVLLKTALKKLSSLLLESTIMMPACALLGDPTAMSVTR